MEILRRRLNDNSRLLEALSKEQYNGAPITVQVYLPDYLDITSLLAMKKRMVETAEISKKKLRLISHTSNLDVEKFATRLFADRDDIFITIDWRNKDEENTPSD